MALVVESGTHDLEWVEVEGGYESGSYRIEPSTGQSRYHWKLTTRPAAAAMGAVVGQSSTHLSLRAARARARYLEFKRLQRIRLLRYTVVGVLAMLVCVPLYWQATTLVQFCLAAVALAVSLRAFANAIDLRLIHAWGVDSVHYVDRVTAMDRLVYRAIHGPSPAIGETPVDEAAVHVLPPVPYD